MKIVMISDTHLRHRKVQVPDGDVLIHAGDFTMVGEENYIKDFNDWLGDLPHSFKVVIPGNHELSWNEEKAALITNAAVLNDSECWYGGLKFYGSPFTPQFGNWAFMLPRGQSIYEKWLQIPGDTDVLITHGPPYGILDQAVPGKSPSVGCKDLGIVVAAVNPQLHVFGHIHGSHGVWAHLTPGSGRTFYVNASVVNEAYQPVFEPVTMEI